VLLSMLFHDEPSLASGFRALSTIGPLGDITWSRWSANRSAVEPLLFVARPAFFSVSRGSWTGAEASAHRWASSA